MGILTFFEPFFRIRRYTVALIVFLVLLVFLLTIGWKWAGRSKNERKVRLIRAAILALIFTPGLGFADGVKVLPLLLALIMMFISPFGSPLVVDILALLIGWWIFFMVLKKDKNLAANGVSPVRRVILWAEFILALMFFGWLWSLVLPIPVTGTVYDFVNMLSSKYQFNLPGRLDDILYLAVFVLLFALLTFLSIWLYMRLARWIARKHIVIVMGFLLISLFLGWQLWPRACDTHESFEDLPNKTCDCRGITFRYYPIMVWDASSVDFCLGIEMPVP